MVESRNRVIIDWYVEQGGGLGALFSLELLQVRDLFSNLLSISKRPRRLFDFIEGHMEDEMLSNEVHVT